MRFPLFANDLRDVDPAEVDIQRVQKSPDFLIVSPVDGLQLLLRKALEKAATGFATRFRVGIDTLEKRIGNRDQDLCHRASISSMSKS